MSRQLALGALPFRLTQQQIVGFHARHPIVLTKISETLALMKLGLYDWDYNPSTDWNLPGVIPPWGLQVEDSHFALVTVFPARNGEFLYTGNSNYLGTDKPEYESPVYPDGVIPTIAGDIANAIKGLALPAMIIGGIYLFMTSRGKQ